ncbi:MAG: methyltransferase domain-containing protein [Pseudobdellovibrionaceae bacterium]|nr:methyltransferase domain-containing protein [Pseudobdellovibrionaceae bacterium]
MVSFSIGFLDIRSRHPWIYKLCLMHRGIAVLDILNIQFYSYELGAKIANLNVGFAAIQMISAGVISLMKRYRPAYFYTLAWTFYLLGTVIMVLKYQGILPLNGLTEYANLVGSCAENGPVLELCCGTGRLTIPLAKAGIDIIRLNFTASMLEFARKKASRDHIEIPWVLDDMRKFNLNRMFNLIFIPFNSLQNTYTIEDVERTFERIKAHLSLGGCFIFSIFNPSLDYIVDCSRSPKVHEVKMPDGRNLTITESCTYDSAHQVNRISWIHKFSDSEKEIPQRLDMGCFFPLEMDALLKYNGWQIVQKFGSFDEDEFKASSPHQIYVCKAK